jgi:hypothetical protein
MKRAMKVLVSTIRKEWFLIVMITIITMILFMASLF